MPLGTPPLPELSNLYLLPQLLRRLQKRSLIADQGELLVIAHPNASNRSWEDAELKSMT